MRLLQRLLIASCAAVALAAVAQADQMPRYEPSQRVRLPAEAGCMKDEVSREAFCVKKCQADFRLEWNGPKASCVGLKVDARYQPPKPEYVPPARPAGPKPPGS